MKVHHLSGNPSLLNQFLAELRDVSIQKDSMRFRRNLERIGEIMAYEISKSLSFEEKSMMTPLAEKKSQLLSNQPVICSILRAGMPLHQGFLNYFDGAENGFISAYRNHYNNDDDFEIVSEYTAVPSIQNKTLLLVDPMLATGQSLVAIFRALTLERIPSEVHIACVIAAPEGIAHLEQYLPENCHLWVAAIDEKLNEHHYIVPGLGDAGDLAYGNKL
ncbi:uracil phosphoribosyltransferase [Flavobacterium silvaticum]|uniref:Uracil phosphoribosyltransferase n=1 Tax=Flavobacterium silvaticum TaxID=1852020 RepID=A0A972FUN6_9FLAO|nr:uracil phosphoribosyltransferase [Flavobacterium silvaticum]NMH28372.1 uracil phosphoribosyltransferase [Flavobacterium silvaticum]